MTTPLRILHILDHSLPLHSGYTFRTAAILRGQHARGWETFHLTTPKQGNDASLLEEEADGLRFYRTPPEQGWSARQPVLGQQAVVRATTRRLDELARRLRPDVLHAHSPVLDAQAALKVGARLGIPVVYEVRGFWEDAAVDHGTHKEGSLRYRIIRGMETHAVKSAAQVTTICEGLRSDLVARGVPAEKITIIPNAVDIDRFHWRRAPDPELQQRYGLQGAKVIGFLGSYYAYEGLDLLIAALPAIRAQRPDAKVLLVGGGPQEAALKAQVERAGLQQAVSFVGRVPHADVDRHYDLVDVLAYPRHSMRLTELVTPLKPLEAMAQGHLLVASDVGGHRELIRDGQTGLLFRADDPQALADAVLKALALPEGGQALREAGRRFVETERNWRASVERYRGVYGRALGRPID